MLFRKILLALGVLCICYFAISKSYAEETTADSASLPVPRVHLNFEGNLENSGTEPRLAPRMFTNDGRISRESANFVSGHDGQAIRFAGGRSVDIPLDVFPGAFPKITFTAWIYVEPEFKNGAGDIVSNNSFLRMHYYSGQLWMSTERSGRLHFTSTDAVPTGEWAFVAGVWDAANATATLFLNGQTKTGAFESENDLSADRSVWLGAQYANKQTVHDLRMDDVRIYDKALTIEQLNELYSGSTSQAQAIRDSENEPSGGLEGPLEKKTSQEPAILGDNPLSGNDPETRDIEASDDLPGTELEKTVETARNARPSRQVRPDITGDSELDRAKEETPEEEPELSSCGREADIVRDDLGNQCRWIIQGQLAVSPELDSIERKYGSQVPLEGVEVIVSSRRKMALVWGSYAPWGKVRTDENGCFRVAVTKSCAPRQLKVRTRFQDENLEIRHENAMNEVTKVRPYVLTEHEDRESGMWDMGLQVFEDGGAGDLGNFEAYRHAQIWRVYHDAIDWMKAQGAQYEFKTQVKIQYPHNGRVSDDREASYANPTNKVIYIVRNSVSDQFPTGLNFDAGTLLHELGHIWAYNHSTGEICLTETLLLKGGETHGLVDDHCTAFYEGFAEYFAEKMGYILGYQDLDYTQLPFSNTYLQTGGYWGDPIDSLDTYQRSDVGWQSYFHTLSLPDIRKKDFWPDASVIGGDRATRRVQEKRSFLDTCAIAKQYFDFKGVLRAFSPGGGEKKNLSREQTTVPEFNSRLMRIFNDFEYENRVEIEELSNPSNPRETYEVIPCPQ